MRSIYLISLSYLVSTTVLADTLVLDPYTPPSRSPIENFGVALGIAEQNQARPLPKIALEMIQDFEGWSESAYNDPAGFCTIGYGHLISLNQCSSIDLGTFATPISKLAGTQLLMKDTLSARLSIGFLLHKDVTDNQFGALVSFVFNVGETNFRKSTLLKLINIGDIDAAATQFGRWIKSNNTIFAGLVQRRACEEALFRGDLRLGENNEFSRKSCAFRGITSTAGPLIDVNIGE